VFGRVFEVKYFQYTLLASFWDKLPRSSTDSLTLQLDLYDSNDFFRFSSHSLSHAASFLRFISSLEHLQAGRSSRLGRAIALKVGIFIESGSGHYASTQPLPAVLVQKDTVSSLFSDLCQRSSLPFDCG
jgi:hypothetical protein